MILLILVLLLVQENIANITVNKDSQILANYVKYVIENHTRKSNGYIGIIVNDNDNHAVAKSLSLIHHCQTNSFFLINFNYFDRDKATIDKLKSQKIYFGYLKILIVFIKTIDELHPVLKNLIKSPLYRTRNELLLIFDQTLTFKELVEVFQYCWKKKFLHVIIIFLKNTKMHIYSYNPFWERERMLENYTDTPYSQDIYYDKLENIYGYKITCLIIRDDDYTKIKIIRKGRKKYYSGVDVDIISNLIKTMNGTPHFVNSQNLLKPGERNPWRDSNVAPKNVLLRKHQIIRKNKIDMMNADEMVLNDDFSGVTESLYPHDKDDLVILLKRGEKIPYYQYLFMIFQTQLWIGLFGFSILVTIFWIFIKRSVKFSEWIIDILTIYRGIICTSIQIVPQRNSERIMFIFWVLFCFIISIAFQSKLTDILMETKYYPDIKTLGELEKSGINICVYRSMQKDLIKALTNTSKQGILKQLVDMDSYYDNVNATEVKYSMDLFHPSIISYNRGVYATRNLIFCSKTRRLLKIIPESPLPRYMALQVTAGSPYLNRLDKNMARLREFGFLIYWFRKWDYYSVLKKFALPLGYNFNLENNEYEILTLNHFTAAFLILFTGLLFSSIVFVIEIIIFKIKNK